MKAYFIFEFNRTFKLKKGLLIIILLGILMLFFVNKELSKKEIDYIDSKIRYTEEMAKKNREVLISSYEQNKEDKDNRDLNSLEEILEKENKFATQELHVYREFKKNNRIPYLQKENANIDEVEFDNIQLRKSILFSDDYPTYIKIKKALNNLLIKRSLPYESTRYGTSNYLFLYFLLSNLCSPIGIAIYLLFFGSIHFKTFSQGNIKTNLTMPISRTSILIVNTTVFLIRIISITFLICLVAFIIASIGSQTIPYDYPIITFNQGLQLMPVFYYLLKIIFSFFLVSTFSFVLCQLIVLLTKTDFMAILLTILIIMGCSFALQTNELNSKSLSAILPFMYTTPSKIITGESKEFIVQAGNSDINGYPKTVILENQEYYVGDSLSKKNHYISDSLGTLVISFWTIITLGISTIVMKKRTF